MIHLDEIVLKVPTDIVSSFDQVIRDFQKVSDPKKNETDTEDRTYLDKLLTESIAFRNAKISQILLSSLSSVMGAGDKVTGHQITISDKDAQYIMLFRKAMEEFFGSYYEIKGDMESKITLISRKTNEEIPYQDLSLGEKEILLLILHVSNSYDLPVIFWLDEPDLGLHVDWQIKLVNCLRNLNPNIQLFVSTHAPSMVEGHFDKVTVTVLMQELGKKELEDEIARLNAQTTMKPQVKQEKISHLKKEQKDFKTVICSNTGFVQQQSPLFQLIQTDLSVL